MRVTTEWPRGAASGLTKLCPLSKAMSFLHHDCPLETSCGADLNDSTPPAISIPKTHPEVFRLKKSSEKRKLILF